MKPEIRPARIEDLPGIISLLNQSGLPSSDLTTTSLTTFRVAESDGELIGVAGFETAGTDGLMRSLAVRQDWRKQGLGERLVSECEQAAYQAGVRTVYLLTSTADDYLRRLGYADMRRETVPPAIAGHAQFRGLCPACAKCLGKSLG